MVKLNLGCEEDTKEGFLNVDINSGKGIDKVYDLNKMPLPWKDSSVDYIYCSHLLEHLKNPTEFMHELHRISKNGAMIDIFVPHFSLFGTYADLTHERPGMSYFTFGNPNWNKSIYKKFKVKAHLNFTRENYKFLNKIFNPLINANPVLYERFFCYILPASEIHFRMKVVK